MIALTMVGRSGWLLVESVCRQVGVGGRENVGGEKGGKEGIKQEDKTGGKRE